MKNSTYVLIILFTVLFMAPMASRATVINVEVKNFEFNPSNFTANVGDTINWFWATGFHTTTSSIIPIGAASWNEPISQSSPSYVYVITTAGNYQYICSPHASMGMTGSFTVLNSTGIGENANPSLAFINSYVRNGELHFNYTIPGATNVSFKLFDIVGHHVYDAKLGSQTAGIYSQTIPLGAFPKGIYILSLIANNSQITKRIIIE
ncbi:MAG: T9SS type A sorting domain-containing protein [Bacteroidota bacterium]|nr:T9SS type A sorting domain-containing protein [Bacteroidota bacterium]